MPNSPPYATGTGAQKLSNEHKPNPWSQTMNITKTFPPTGHKRWIIAGGRISAANQGLIQEIPSHETACILNVSDEDAHVQIWIFYSDREPVGPYHRTVRARRTNLVRYNDLNEPAPIPHEVDFASVIESDVPVVVQHTRLDSRQAENMLITTMAFADTESVM